LFEQEDEVLYPNPTISRQQSLIVSNQDSGSMKKQASHTSQMKHNNSMSEQQQQQNLELDKREKDIFQDQRIQFMSPQDYLAFH
jgi:hypothetical protein